jgi:hypothetical protein
MPTAATTTASSDQNRLKLPTRLHDEAFILRSALFSRFAHAYQRVVNTADLHKNEARVCPTGKRR